MPALASFACCCLCLFPAAAVEKTAAGNNEGQRITFNVIKQRLNDVLYKVTSQKFEDPGEMHTDACTQQACIQLGCPACLRGCLCQ